MLLPASPVSSGILTDSESRMRVRDIPFPILVARLEELGFEDVASNYSEDATMQKWFDFFRDEGHDFGILYSWASRYFDRHPTGSGYPSILRQAGPTEFNLEMTSVAGDPFYETCLVSKVDVNHGPEFREIKFGSAAEKALLDTRHEKTPIRTPTTALRADSTSNKGRKPWITKARHIYPRRVWDLYSNRVIPFDWLVWWRSGDISTFVIKPEVQTSLLLLLSFSNS